MDEAWLIWSVLFGGIGLGMLVYGRRQKRMVPFGAGLVLMGAPYFFDSAGPLMFLGLAAILGCYFFRY